ncbi:hypothetical protein [Massilia sp. Leaf139]|uniref:Tse2 family ADP-ribosyltransferase toxin n=1 Tax=Massilia sp. Leaf139 TaxID=1736272 RepID=UPI000713C115|nr:hypothetical protein [Massilia sp. Leaf139]KQQ97212.1 hypothetical protein ASF77_04445 [Massilia sp. Leaf139]
MPTTKTDLFRAMKTGQSDGEFHIEGVARDGLLYPRFEATEYYDADKVKRVSQADIDIKRNDVSGELEVQTKGGTSLHDKSGWFGHDDWRYFQIPNGTDYPEGIVLHKGKGAKQNRARTVRATHYQIEPKIPMTVDAFKGALDTFARAAVVRSIALAKAVK